MLCLLIFFLILRPLLIKDYKHIINQNLFFGLWQQFIDILKIELNTSNYSQLQIFYTTKSLILAQDER